MFTGKNRARWDEFVVVLVAEIFQEMRTNFVRRPFGIANG